MTAACRCRRSAFSGEAFLEQFVANESATSDLQMRRAIIGVFTFLVTPGVYIMMTTMSSFELR